MLKFVLAYPASVSAIFFPYSAAKNPAGLRSFEYHCAHSYWAYREVCEAIFGEEGKQIAERVLDDFAAEYGKKMADTLAGYARTNFNIAD